MAMIIQMAPFIILIVVFYFMLIRPQRKRDKAENEMRRNLEVGDEVTTRGGLVGRVSNIKDDIITIETGANKVKISVQRWAIATKEEKISD
ncbi:MAG: preprotein translocase subunit YajC [Oscillospiraceae bacterium]|nr:preprotein translocase subunit YajC [Oscillospiraceae bacterium]